MAWQRWCSLPRRRSRAFVCAFSSPVVGLHSVGRRTSRRFCRVRLGTKEFLRPQGAISQAFTPFGGGVIAWRLRRLQKGECRQGWRYFWSRRTRVGFGSTTGPTLKTALCHIRALVGRMINKPRSTQTLSGATRLHKVGSYVIVVAFTSPPLLVIDSTPFFSTNCVAPRLNPISCGRFTLLFFIALVCTKGSARPFGCIALKVRVNL